MENIIIISFDRIFKHFNLVTFTILSAFVIAAVIIYPRDIAVDQGSATQTYKVHHHPV